MSAETEHYLAKAVECDEHARRASNKQTRRQWERIAEEWRAVADLSEKRSSSKPSRATVIPPFDAPHHGDQRTLS